MARSVFAAAALVLAAVSQCGVAAQLAEPPLSAGSHSSGPVLMGPNDIVSFLAVCLAHPADPIQIEGSAPRQTVGPTR